MEVWEPVDQSLPQELNTERGLIQSNEANLFDIEELISDITLKEILN